ncbi:hypothetical protein L2E82_15265 [Cichorium intybus]|uniref:Uncharacterized protein n=1 Tax=Cichorium intybus TaxID=13427 RepID=A0ACB9F2R7_CICIN|nr:hypothetical protein L2E82_15265 [Cichorium intybus]
MNADPNATGVAKQSNYELVSCLFLFINHNYFWYATLVMENTALSVFFNNLSVQKLSPRKLYQAARGCGLSTIQTHAINLNIQKQHPKMISIMHI